MNLAWNADILSGNSGRLMTQFFSEPIVYAIATLWLDHGIIGGNHYGYIVLLGAGIVRTRHYAL